MISYYNPAAATTATGLTKLGKSGHYRYFCENFITIPAKTI